jgi:hypothetical protein
MQMLSKDRGQISRRAPRHQIARSPDRQIAAGFAFSFIKYHSGRINPLRQALSARRSKGMSTG